MSLLDKIKELFAETAPVVESNFAEVKTNEGRILRIVEDKVTEITEEGEIELADGDYTLEDGSILVVVGGLIKEKKEAVTEEAPVEAPAEEMEEVPEAEVEVEVEAPAKEADLEERVKVLEEAIAMLVEKMSEEEVKEEVKEEEKKEEVMESVDSEIELLKAENEALKIANEKLSKVPVAEPIKTAKFEKIIGASNKNANVNTELLGKISALREQK